MLGTLVVRMSIEEVFSRAEQQSWYAFRRKELYNVVSQGR
jgi:hypothetical protein